MPRGVKKDEVSMRFTTFHIPSQMNQKQGGSHYIKTEEQTLWGRNRRSAKALAGEGNVQEGRRGANVLVIHPGTRFLRIGRASDVFPIAVPHVIARRSKAPVPPPVYVSSVAGRHGRRVTGKEPAAGEGASGGADNDGGAQELWDPVDPKTSPIASSLRDRMLFYKLNIVPNATEVCTSFNDQVQPEIIPDHNDPYRVDWVTAPTADVLVGEKALRLADPSALGYTVRWPFRGRRFNSFDYAGCGVQALVNDVETLWRVVLHDMLKIDKAAYKDYSVVLMVPDLFERPYVRELVQILLVQMGFKQVCVQQESVGATYGAGISNACVIDAGAATTSIAIVEEGLVVPDTRICLNVGGDDITSYLFALLEHVRFPYRDANLARASDWSLMDDLKARICTLAEGEVVLTKYDFFVRRAGRQTEKYNLHAYNEVILAPMCMFEPRVIEFEHKRAYTRPLWNPGVGEEMVEQVGENETQAMMISTQHLLPPPGPVPVPVPVPGSVAVPMSTFPPMDPSAAARGRPVFAVAPQAAGDAGPLQAGSLAGQTASKFISLDTSSFEVKDRDTGKDGPAPGPVPGPPGRGGPRLDVSFEAGKLPLDVAIFNSARAAGGDEKIRKFLQAVLVVGGSARVPGMGHALESRLQAIASPLVANMEKVQIIAPPRDVDPRVLCWKGGAVLGKMDAVGDLWVGQGEWEMLGMRALKERSFFL